ncbi:unnamed protein product [Soboliphyme baturini]|uniref:protein-serine/threonine phosphatase n=1 Tax=Soboliphyme baturini TaxID=241478 RepID=A0A183ICL2_9BILA|nr:unnamed protein product [Soboliphyme baturini]
MGATLSEPETTRETHSCANGYVKVGSSSMQGWRISMEDAHTHLLAIPDDKDASFFGVYDGHGGASVSQHASYNLHKFIVQSQAYRDGNITEAIREGFLKMDDEILNNAEIRAGYAGTTANIVMLKNDTLYCGNVGDSRAVISHCGLAEALSVDHKPLNEPESERIYAAGGFVEFNRVNGNLAMSRALGDFIYKQNEQKSPQEQIVVGTKSSICDVFDSCIVVCYSAYPDVISRKITDDDEFILLACDGIWDVLTNQEVIDFCRDRIAIGMEPENICEEMLLHCLAPDCQMAGLGCDNMTVILVCLLQNRPYQELQKKCQRPRPASPTNDEQDFNVPEANSVDHDPEPKENRVRAAKVKPVRVYFSP